MMQHQHTSPPPLRQPRQPHQDEFLAIVEAIRARPGVARAAGLDTSGVCTLKHRGVEFIEGPILRRHSRSLQYPVVLKNISLAHDGIHLEIGAPQDSEAGRLIALLRQAGPVDIERQVRFLHPALAYPQLHGDKWGTWALTRGSKAEQQRAQAGTIDGALSAALQHLPAAGGTVLFLGCGRCLEIRKFLERMPRQMRSQLRIFGIDSCADLLAEGRRELGPQSGVTLLHDDISGAARHFAPGQVNLLIGVGVFDMQTLEFQRGLALLTAVRPVIADGARAVFAAYGGELFQSEHYRALGFRVEACLNPARLYSDGQERDAYLLKHDASLPAAASPVSAAHAEADLWKAHPRLLQEADPFLRG